MVSKINESEIQVQIMYVCADKYLQCLQKTLDYYEIPSERYSLMEEQPYCLNLKYDSDKNWMVYYMDRTITYLETYTDVKKAMKAFLKLITEGNNEAFKALNSYFEEQLKTGTYVNREK